MYVTRITERNMGERKWKPVEWSETFVSGDLASGICSAVRSHMRKGNPFSLYVDCAGECGEIRMHFDDEGTQMRQRMEFRKTSRPLPERVWTE